MGVIWPYLGILLVVAIFYFWERKNPSAVNRFEENVIAIIMAVITIVSFVQVIARYGINTGWGGALEFTRIAFAWLILFGMSYALKINAHLGVDAFIRMLPKKPFKVVAIFGALCCLMYAVILISATWLEFFGANSKGGAVDYWSKMFKLGIGLDDLRYPEWMQNTFGLQERVQRWIAYLILPVGLGLFGFRSLQAIIAIWRGDRELIIAGHEAEELVAENKDKLKD